MNQRQVRCKCAHWLYLSPDRVLWCLSWALCSTFGLSTSWALTRWATRSFSGRILVLGCCQGRWRKYFRFNFGVLPEIFWRLTSLMSVFQPTNTRDVKQTGRDSSAGVVTSPRPGKPKNLVSFFDNGQELLFCATFRVACSPFTPTVSRGYKELLAFG
jgi:hypothetical protein